MEMCFGQGAQYDVFGNGGILSWRKQPDACVKKQ